MNDLIIGGIYRTMYNNYLIVVQKVFKNEYIVAAVDGNQITQKELLEIQSIPNIKFRFTRLDSKIQFYYFNKGYCGKITKKFLDKLIDRSYLSIPHQL